MKDELWCVPNLVQLWFGKGGGSRLMKHPIESLCFGPLYLYDHSQFSFFTEGVGICVFILLPWESGIYGLFSFPERGGGDFFVCLLLSLFFTEGCLLHVFLLPRKKEGGGALFPMFILIYTEGRANCKVFFFTGGPPCLCFFYFPEDFPSSLQKRMEMTELFLFTERGVFIALLLHSLQRDRESSQ